MSGSWILCPHVCLGATAILSGDIIQKRSIRGNRGSNQLPKPRYSGLSKISMRNVWNRMQQQKTEDIGSDLRLGQLIPTQFALKCLSFQGTAKEAQPLRGKITCSWLYSTEEVLGGRKCVQNPNVVFAMSRCYPELKNLTACAITDRSRWFFLENS